MRASGTDRYAVASRVNALAWPAMAPGTAYLASGEETTNAFAGALLAARQKRPLYVTVPFCSPAGTGPSLAGPGVTRVALLGGEGSVRVLAGRLGKRAAASTPRRACGPWSTSAERSSPRPTCPPSSSSRRCRTRTPSGCAPRQPPRWSAWPPHRRPKEQGESGSRPATGRTRPSAPCTTRGSPPTVRPTPTSGSCAPGTASTRPVVGRPQTHRPIELHQPHVH